MKRNEEVIYQTEAAMKRISRVNDVEKAFMAAENGISLYGYLSIGVLRYWDLSRDVNYAYAEWIYPFDDIARRIERMFPGKSLEDSCRQLVESLGIKTRYSGLDTVKEMLNHSETYGRVLLTLSKYERQQGYVDALDLED